MAAFLLSQRRVISSDSYPYLLLNLAGGCLLAVSAAGGSQWGFLLLEIAWTGVAAWSILGRLSGRAAGMA